MKIDFATFCYKNDVYRLHAPGQLKKQVESNGYQFDTVHVIYQGINPLDYGDSFLFPDCNFTIVAWTIDNIDELLMSFEIKLDGQYQSPTDKHHTWKPHVVNHLAAIQHTNADYIVMADNDCWMVRQPDSWIKLGIEALQVNPNLFIVSPNDGEPKRLTQRMSQQMFLVKVDDFRRMDFNQPGWDGNVNIEGGPMPEYHSMLEGRMAHYCIYENRYRYVLGSEYRYYHHNRLNKNGLFETDYKKLGWE